VRPGPVARVADHLDEHLPARVADEDHRVPCLAVLGHQRSVAFSVVDGLDAERPRDGADVRRVLGVAVTAAAGAEAQQVEHHDRPAGVLGEEPVELRLVEVDHVVSPGCLSISK
jgi:hypothetical protein